MQTVYGFCAITIDTLLYSNLALSPYRQIVTSLKQYNSLNLIVIKYDDHIFHDFEIIRRNHGIKVSGQHSLSVNMAP